MRDLFRGYYAPSEVELEHIWDRGLIVLDTNALLNLFRYTESTRNDFVLVLRALKNRLWIPYQVALEFQRRRLDVIEDQAKAFDDIDSAIKAAGSGIAKAVQNYRLHPSLDKGATTELLNSSMKAMSDAVETSREEYRTRVVADGTNERVYDLITELYQSRVGEAFDQESLDALYVEGAKRYEAKIPPGFEDRDKPEPNRYGDLVLWRQLLAKVTHTKQPALFITDDGKDDWWRRVKGKTYGPRVELVDEYFAASGERVHFYSPERFLDFAKVKMKIAVSNNSLDEVKKVSMERSSSELQRLRNHLGTLNSDRELFEAKRYERAYPSPSEIIANTNEIRVEVDRLRAERSEIEDQRAVLRGVLVDMEPGETRDQIERRSAELEDSLTSIDEVLLSQFGRLESISRGSAYAKTQRSARASAENKIKLLEYELRKLNAQVHGDS